MSCESHLEVLDLPPELRTSSQESVLQEHLASCAHCRALSDTFEVSLAHEAAWLGPELKGEQVEAILSRVCEPAQAVGQLLSFPQRIEVDEGLSQQLNPRLQPSVQGQTLESPWFSRVASRTILSLMAACLAAFILWNPYGSDRRLKGGEEVVPLQSVDLQAVVEGPNGSYLRAAERKAVVGPGDGLIFRFLVDGEGKLLLIQRDPNHQLSVVWSSTVQGSSGGPQSMEISSSMTGRPLRYVPDGPPGVYTYVAILSREHVEESPALLDEIWNVYAAGEMSGEGSNNLEMDSLTLSFEVKQ